MSVGVTGVCMYTLVCIPWCEHVWLGYTCINKCIFCVHVELKCCVCAYSYAVMYVGIHMRVCGVLWEYTWESV